MLKDFFAIATNIFLGHFIVDNTVESHKYCARFAENNVFLDCVTNVNLVLENKACSNRFMLRNIEIDWF